MTDPNVTRASLVFRLRDRTDDLAWTQFLDLYGQMLFQFVRSRGLQDADAADLVQEIFRRVSNSIDRFDYQKKKGGFRAWLFTITRNCLNTFLVKKQKSAQPINNSNPGEMLGQLPAADEMDACWEMEFQRQIMSQAIGIVRPNTDPKTWAAFEMTAIENHKIDHVCETLDMSRGAIYVARSRITSKLRDEVQRIMEEES